MRLLPAAALVAAAAMSTTVTTSCKDDSSLDTADVDTSVVIPTMLTRDVETLISDSGVTRYRIVTPIWYVYDEVEEPYWRFPEGLNLNKYDNFFRTEATVRADSAIYLKRKQTWQLDGNVSISNVMNEKFLTQQLFWDQRTQNFIPTRSFTSSAPTVCSKATDSSQTNNSHATPSRRCRASSPPRNSRAKAGKRKRSPPTQSKRKIESRTSV